MFSKLRNITRIFPCFSWGIFSHATSLDQSRANEKFDVFIGASALVSESRGTGSSPGRKHRVVFLGKSLAHSASLYPGVKMGNIESNVGGNPSGVEYSSLLHATETGIKLD